MALRDQPYLPLYVQDYLTDEKLAICSWSTQGIYIKILCILHKQKEYGTILFKQNDKQILSTCLNFASIFVRLLPVQLSEMEAALQELVDNEILTIDGNKIFQKRMVKDNTISEMRSKAAKKGGGNPILFKQKNKQNPEYENEYENVINNDNKIINKVEKKEEFSMILEYPLEKVKDIILNDQSYIETLSMNNHITVIKTIQYVEEFCKKLENEGINEKSIRDFKSHFARWLNIELKKESQSKPLQSEREKRMEGVRQLKADSAAILEHLNIKLS